MKKSRYLYDNKKKCSGCGACYQICPTSAIHMEKDKEGFLYPIIDNGKCIRCGMCKKSCPIINYQCKTDNILGCYVGYNQNTSVRLNSSSGGVFSIIAEFILCRGGVVYGVAYDNQWNTHHICVEDKKDLQMLRGSKYIQSKTENSFKETKERLERGQYVLYSGTECQISGLKRYLNKEYDNLITVGVLCHGVPSQLVWEKYIQNKIEKNQSNISAISFRNKDSGWKDYSVVINFENGNIYRSKMSQDKYMNMFLSEICLRPSCYDCKFKKLERNSDITLGDCWGIERYMPEMDDNNGTSVILIHSKKGKKIFESIKNELNYKESDKDKAISPYADSRNSVVPHINRKKYLKAVNKGDNFDNIAEIIKMTKKDKIRKKCISVVRKVKKLSNSKI